ncbi:Protein RarD [bioreactor metagenome]|uniref:Protein RarD n=1 Tax=bioreactor metagenome TaxID=1076179 RepID=A0A645IH31_9ZZZZ
MVTTVPLLLFGYGVKHLPYSIVGIIQYISPTIQLLLGVFLYGEEFTSAHLITFILIWAALILFIRSKMKAAKEQTAIAEMEQVV